MEILMACGRRFVLLAFKSKNRCASGRERVEGRHHGRACAPSRGDTGRRFKRDEGLLNLALQCLASICAADDRRAPVRRGDNARQFGDDF